MEHEYEIDLSILMDFPAVRLGDFCGPWSVHAERLTSEIEMLRTMDLRAHMQHGVNIAPLDYSMTSNGIAVIGISGMMTKRGNSMSSAGSTVRARQAIRNAARNDSVKGIMVHIESPGGTVAGTKELADELRAVEKPTAAHFEDIGASAAYYVGSQAGHVSANSPSIIGSIGTYMVIYDYSEMFEKGGIKAHLITTGDYKGAGAKGTKVTDEQIEEDQLIIDQSNELFLDAVAQGRSMSSGKVKEVATGQVWLAKDAASLGLIDAVYSFENAMAAFSERIASMTNPKGQPVAVDDIQPESVAETATESVPPVVADATAVAPAPVTQTATVESGATLSELEASCPGAPPEFLLSQIKANATVSQALTSFVLHLQQENAKAAAQPQKAKPPAPVGVAPVGTSTNTSSFASAIDEWREALNKKVAAGMKRDKAVVSLQRENPQLHENYLAEYSTVYPSQPPKQ